MLKPFLPGILNICNMSANLTRFVVRKYQANKMKIIGVFQCIYDHYSNNFDIFAYILQHHDVNFWFINPITTLNTCKRTK